MNRDNYFSGWKHIRLAKPIPTERELAEKKAREEFALWYYAQPQPLDAHKIFDEYILKTQKS